MACVCTVKCGGYRGTRGGVSEGVGPGAGHPWHAVCALCQPPRQAANHGRHHQPWEGSWSQVL